MFCYAVVTVMQDVLMCKIVSIFLMFVVDLISNHIVLIWTYILRVIHFVYSSLGPKRKYVGQIIEKTNSRKYTIYRVWGSVSDNLAVVLSMHFCM